MRGRDAMFVRQGKGVCELMCERGNEGVGGISGPSRPFQRSHSPSLLFAKVIDVSSWAATDEFLTQLRMNCMRPS
jgi:hypothetical protein